MTAPPLRRPTTPVARGQLLLLALLALLTAGAWALTVQQARTMEMPMGVVIPGTDGEGMTDPETMDAMAMDGMAMDGAGEMAATGMASAGWSLDDFGAFVAAWAVMMAAMMFPAAAWAQRPPPGWPA